MNNEPKILRERKQSLNKQTEQSLNRQSKQRSASSLPKKTVSSNTKISAPHTGSYLLAWGQIPTCNKISQPTKIAKNIIKHSVGEKHIVFINDKYQCFGMGDSVFGQLGYVSEDQAYNSTALPILEDQLIQQVFSTPFCTFLVNNRNDVFGCGLNNRGQLGIGHTQIVTTPNKIQSLSKWSPINEERLSLAHRSDKKFSPSINMAEKISRSYTKIQNYALAERTNSKNTNQSNFIDLEMENTEQTQKDSIHLLEDTQRIVDFVGGPFHTAALTSNGRVFYTGNIYKKSSVLNNQFAPQFTQLNLRKIGKVQKIKAGQTCLLLLNTQGSLFVLGALSQNIVCDQPYNVGVNCIIDFGLTKQRIYVTTAIGELFVIAQTKKSLKTIKWLGDSCKKFKEIECGLDFCLLVDEDGFLFTDDIPSRPDDLYLGGTVQKSVNRKDNEESKSNQINIKKVDLGNLFLHQIKMSLNFGVGKCERAPIPIEFKKEKENVRDGDNKENEGLNKKIRQLEKQNKMLKQFLREETENNHKNKSTKKNQNALNGGLAMSTQLVAKESTSKFQITNKVSSRIAHKARTFDPSLQIPFEELQLGKVISEGGYGVIYKAVWRKTTVAVKRFKIDTNSENSVKDFISQCHAMEALRHPNIVMFLGACTKPPNFAIVLEYCEGGTLWTMMQNKSKGDIDWEQRRNLALDTAKGMNYLHQRTKPILHRDLKSLNLLLDQNNRVKLADFGWTKGLQNYMTGKIGTYQWMAPEVVSSHQYTEKADVFSFAIILWEIASRQAPYRNIPGVQVAQDVLHKDLRPTIPQKTPKNFSKLMKRCWDKDPNKRPSFFEIIEELEKMEF